MPGDFTREREEMVERQIIARGIRDAGVIEAMRRVPRHIFVPEEIKCRAYEDSALAISHGQTISQPYIVAYMTELIKPGKDLRLLEIGTGTGYQSAVAAEVFGEVYTVEIIRELSEAAGVILNSLGYKNIKLKIGDGYYGWEEYVPYDRIIITAAPPKVPENLLHQLKPGGILVAPVGTENQYILKITKGSNGKSVYERMIDVRFVRMVGETEKNP